MKISDIKTKLRSRTLDISRKFVSENARTIRNIHFILLSLLYEVFISTTKEESILPMIGNLHEFLPSTCACISPDCNKLSALPSPYTKQLQLNKFFIRSDEIKHEFLKNANNVLDWIFRKSKILNQVEENMTVLKDALLLLDSKEIRKVLKDLLKIYITKWISFSFNNETNWINIKSRLNFCNNTFIKLFVQTISNSPLIEDEEFQGKKIPIRQYLHFGNIIQASFDFIVKNHKAREKKSNCKCCICSSSFSPEDIEFVFIKNFVRNARNQTKETNQSRKNYNI